MNNSKSFRERFDEISNEDVYGQMSSDVAKDFFSTELKNLAREVIEAKRSVCHELQCKECSPNYGYNKAIEDIAKLIENY
jgi:hypothetical protein